MQLPKRTSIFFFAAIALLPGLHGLPTEPSQSSAPAFCGWENTGGFESSQTPQGPDFIGSAVCPNPLRKRIQLLPKSSCLHADQANSRTLDASGPLGRNLNVTTVNIPYQTIYFDAYGGLYAILGGRCNGEGTTLTQGFAAIHPDTWEIEAVWQPSGKYANTTMNWVYLQLLKETEQVVVSSGQGQVYVLQKRQDAKGSTTFVTQRFKDFNCTTSNDASCTDVLKGQTLLSAYIDTADNLWFTTGCVSGVGGVCVADSTVIGYLEPDDTVHHLEIPDQTIENAPGLRDTTLFISTGPSATKKLAPLTGYMIAVRPGSPGSSSVEMVWRATYDAGSSQKPGAFARGIGTSTGLLGHDFVAAVDNADVQVNLLIYRQNGTGTNVQPYCKIPLFQPNSSRTDNAMINHFDGENYGVVVQNEYNAPRTDPTNMDRNQASGNNLTVMGYGIEKYSIAGDGSGCRLEWKNPGRMTTSSILSTATGLIYGWEQDEQLANEGQYDWYATALDWETGKTVWKKRAGAGGAFNNNYRVTFVGGHNKMYQTVDGGQREGTGLVIVQDGDEDELEHHGKDGPGGHEWSDSRGGYGGHGHGHGEGEDCKSPRPYNGQW